MTYRVALAALLMLPFASAAAAGRPKKSAPPAPSGSAAPTAPAPPPSPAVMDAQTRFRRALDLYQEGNLDAARTEFRRAYEIAPNYKLLYNLGQVEFELKDYASALSRLTQYLNDGGDQVPEARREQVQKDIEKLKGRLATVELTVNVEGADVLVDDTKVGTAPLASPLLVSAGRRRISVSRPGYVTEVRSVDLGGGDRATLQFALQEVPAPREPLAVDSLRAASTPIPRRIYEPSSSRPVPWVGWTVTAILAGSAGVTGVLALNASQKLRQDRRSFGIDRAELDRMQREVNGLALASDICSGAAILAGGISVYLTLSRGHDKAEAQVRIVPGPGDISVAGTF